MTHILTHWDDNNDNYRKKREKERKVEEIASSGVTTQRTVVYDYHGNAQFDCFYRTRDGEVINDPGCKVFTKQQNQSEANSSWNDW